MNITRHAPKQFAHVNQADQSTSSQLIAAEPKGQNLSACGLNTAILILGVSIF